MNVLHFFRSSRQECKNQSEGRIFTFVIALQKYASLIFALQKIEFSLFQIFTVFLIPEYQIIKQLKPSTIQNF